jgi:hypothetical protein
VSRAREERRDAAWDALAAATDGLPIGRIAGELGTTVRAAYLAVRDLRHFLADDTINVESHPTGRGPWTYRLVGQYVDARWWIANRVLDCEARVRTIEAVLRPLVQNVDGRTIVGRKVLIVHRGVRRILEDLDDLTPRLF